MSQAVLEGIGIHTNELPEHNKIKVHGLRKFCDLHEVQNGTADIRLTIDEFPDIKDGGCVGIGTIKLSFDGCNSLIIVDNEKHEEVICHDRVLFSSFKEGDHVMLTRKGDGFEVRAMNVVKAPETFSKQIGEQIRPRLSSLFTLARSIMS